MFLRAINMPGLVDMDLDERKRATMLSDPETIYILTGPRRISTGIEYGKDLRTSDDNSAGFFRNANKLPKKGVQYGTIGGWRADDLRL